VPFIGLQEINNSPYRFLFPDAVFSEIMAHHLAVALHIFDFNAEELVIQGLTADHAAIRYNIGLKLNDSIRGLVLSYLMKPESVNFILNSFA
jgi:hypothetical protein